MADSSLHSKGEFLLEVLRILPHKQATLKKIHKAIKLSQSMHSVARFDESPGTKKPSSGTPTSMFSGHINFFSGAAPASPQAIYQPGYEHEPHTMEYVPSPEDHRPPQLNNY